MYTPPRAHFSSGKIFLSIRWKIWKKLNEKKKLKGENGIKIAELVLDPITIHQSSDVFTPKGDTNQAYEPASWRQTFRFDRLEA